MQQSYIKDWKKKMFLSKKNRKNTHKWVFLMAFLFCVATAFAQRDYIEAKGEAMVLIEDDVSINKTKAIAKERAIVNAIENKFGRIIIDGNTSYVENIQTGDRVKTKTSFSSLSETMLRADWIKDKTPPKFEKIDDANGSWIKCTVRGFIREITEAKTNYKVETLNCPEKKCATTSYKNGADFFLYFQSPINGFLTIFLADEESSFRLLPYANGHSYKIKADEEYILFTEKEKNAQQYQLFTQKMSEINKLYVVFSASAFHKPTLNKKSKEEIEDINEKTSVNVENIPTNLPIKEFTEWLHTIRLYNSDVQYRVVAISISK